MSAIIGSEASPPPQLSSSSGTNPYLSWVNEVLDSLRSDKVEAIESEHSKVRISELVEILRSVSATVDDELSEEYAFEILSSINGFIESLSVNQEVLDAVSFELPKSVVRFASASRRCLEMAETIVRAFVRKCNPRDMLSILCEAFGSADEMCTEPSYFAPLLSGLSQAFVLMRRRKFEQIKSAVPVVLRALKVVSLVFDDDDLNAEILFQKAIALADSIRTVCDELEGKDNIKLHALLGLFVLEIMALVTMGLRHKVSQSLPLIMLLSRFLRYSGLSYIGLITGSDNDKLIDLLTEDDDDCLSCFSYIQHGASLAVIWGCKSTDVATCAEADIGAVTKELHYNQAKRWEAVGMLKHVFSSANVPWNLKQQAVDFLLSIMDTNMSVTSLDGTVDCSVYIPALYSSLQALESVIMYTPDAVSRKKAFAAFKKVIADIPASLRLDICKELVKNSHSSSMTAVLLDCVKEEMHSAITKRTSTLDGVLVTGHRPFEVTCFWSADVLQFVEMVLRPPNGGPPSLPDYSDAVLSALNLYRYTLMTESNGKSNYTGVLCKDQLLKAYREWLLPLRTLVTGIEAENRNDSDELACDVLCSLNPVALVLYRCIELVEENLQRLSQ